MGLTSVARNKREHTSCGKALLAGGEAKHICPFVRPGEVSSVLPSRSVAGDLYKAEDEGVSWTATLKGQSKTVT